MPQQMAESQLSTEEQVSTIWGLGGLPALQLWKKVIAGINDDNLLGRASELAYNFILALFPFMLFLLALFGIFASRAAALKTNLLTYLSQVLPPSASQVLSHTLNEVTRNASNGRSEEHTSELQSHHDLVCRLLLE